MSIKFPLSEFFQSSGNAAAEFTENLRDGIATFACDLWSIYPRFITEGTNPGSSFARGFMNQMCSPIQPPVPPPNFPFLGGQCPGVIYNASGTAIVAADNSFLGLTRGQVIDVFVLGDLTGAISVISVQPFDEFQNAFVDITDSIAPAQYQIAWDNGAGTFFSCGWLTDQAGNVPAGTAWITTATIDTLTRADGMPDNCGNPPGDYPSNPPTSNDLKTIINITNLDTVDNNYTLVYNKVTNQYNFPMNFKLNGTNVTLDIGGITIYGAPEVIMPTSGNDVPPPGSDGGEDGAGGNNDETYPDTEYPVLPDLTVPTTVEQLVEYVVCTDGVIETITTVISTVTGNIPIVNLILSILTNILSDVCEITEVEPTVGLPDYYGLKVGVDRPAIVYLYKEFINGTWDASTYSSTVTHPTTAAVAAINTIAVPDKTMGTFVTSLVLNDGSRVKVSGDTEASSLTNFNFLLNQVEPSLIPVNVNDCIVVSEYNKLQVKTVKCRQIEYYPNGKQAGTSPDIRRVIDA